MVDALLDTSVIIDLLRQYDPAKQWLIQQQNVGISALVWIEVLQGSANRIAERRAIKFLRRFERVDLTSKDMRWAIEQLTRYHLSHSVGGMDCLIAASSHRLQVPLFTTNLKHFTPILGPLAQKPY